MLGIFWLFVERVGPGRHQVLTNVQTRDRSNPQANSHKMVVGVVDGENESRRRERGEARGEACTAAQREKGRERARESEREGTGVGEQSWQ